MNTIKRIKKIFQNSNEEIDAILIKNGIGNFIDPNFFYATGLVHGMFESCSLVLFPDGIIHVVVTELESMIAKQIPAVIHIYQSKTEMENILKDILTDAKSIGINHSALLLSDYKWIANVFNRNMLKDVTQAFHTTRMVKDDDEIHAIQKACEIADRVMIEVGSYVKKQMSENELAAEIDYHLQRYGAQHPAFETIASFGPHTAQPHYTHDQTQLKDGDFILCDFGASYNNYHSDITRTFVFGRASNKQKEIHDTVQNAQQQAIKMIHPDVSSKKIHEHVKTFVNNTTFKNCFIHSTGHSLGLSVHDPGITLSSICDVKLQEKMILTVEPGIYIQDYGGVRIEDDIIITSDGCKVMTKSIRSLQEV